MLEASLTLVHLSSLYLHSKQTLWLRLTSHISMTTNGGGFFNVWDGFVVLNDTVATEFSQNHFIRQAMMSCIQGMAIVPRKGRMYAFTHFHFLFNHQLFIVNTHSSKIVCFVFLISEEMPKTAIWFLPGDPRNSAPQYQIFPHLMWLWVDSKCAASFDDVVSNKKKSLEDERPFQRKTASDFQWSMRLMMRKGEQSANWGHQFSSIYTKLLYFFFFCNLSSV